MDFSIVSDTAGARVGELVSELRHILKNRINSKFQEYNVSVGIAVRCLPQNYNRKSFVRYTKADNYLTIDFCVVLEEYLEKYKIEQRYELGKTFLEWLEAGLQNKAFIKNNPNLDIELLFDYVVELGQKEGWFVEEIDWSLDLDK
ncbi:hypothetical protein [Bacteroides heparinolyticus]|uniref:hypothetical protein n=1 Tax=Prevotella heparinolytica TaxID=28113 RepID=UPI0035A00706